jgi:heat shock protein HslJ
VIPTRAWLMASLLTAAIGVGGCSRVPGGVDTTTGGRTAADVVEVSRVEWQLQEISGPNGVWPVRAFDSVLRFDGRGGWSAQACNHFNGSSEHGDGWIEFTWHMTTEMGCAGELGRLQREVSAVLHERVDVELTEGVLSLGPAGGLRLTYRERDILYPTAQAETVVAGDRGTAQYRVAVSGEGSSLGLTIETRSAPGTAWGINAFGSPEPEFEPGLWTYGAAEIAGEQLLAGFAPPGTARVAHRGSPGAVSAHELVLEDVAGSPWIVWHGFVPHHDQDSEFIAHDEDGQVLKRW